MTQLPGFFKNYKRSILIGLLVSATLAILFGTLFPADYSLPDEAWDYDKIGHLLMFGVWTFLYGLIQIVRNKFNMWMIFLGGSLFGLSIELLQLILPTNRSAELADFMADTLGAGVAVLALYFLRKKIRDAASGSPSEPLSETG